MSEHTPGPWHAGLEDPDGPDDSWVVFGLSFWVEIASSNVEADARLIAAAPDLLALLEDWLQFDADGSPSWTALRHDTREAIAKARGNVEVKT